MKVAHFVKIKQTNIPKKNLVAKTMTHPQSPTWLGMGYAKITKLRERFLQQGLSFKKSFCNKVCLYGYLLK